MPSLESFLEDIHSCHHQVGLMTFQAHQDSEQIAVDVLSVPHMQSESLLVLVTIAQDLYVERAERSII